ncbi:phosphate signaling complex protein PhoU [Methanosphaerula palustris]|uniref:Phosphate-specific transport system accessory protein PhoU n=1 Tax=Methanosphaerula palustris (strain ATCC BAA-1556 / DSM 19958 / E1-9c) TaxID=521011 RepID=B8GKH4_METPE|nr:phosphate signaling complex protein PhoU [Methanosphaerula palustris]ACL15857.1 phosphate uptake regulator, PhoU [Methanosphaerula palustris E1-9c]
MTEKFLTELEELRGDILSMAEMAESMLQCSVEALKTQDTDLADQVIAQKNEIKERNYRIEDRCIQLITLHQPVAKDMRMIFCILKISSALERVGRYGKDIANVVYYTAETPHLAHLLSIPHMSVMVIGMVSDVITAFREGDATILSDYTERDNEVDALGYSIFRECITYMLEDPATITRCMNYVMVARYLERSGDHACKMAELITFMVTGKRTEFE